jgi:hypothetical protein
MIGKPDGNFCRHPRLQGLPPQAEGRQPATSMAQRPRYRCEWLAELDEMERRHIAKMLPALRILLSAPAVGRALEPTSDWPPEQARAHNGIASSHHAVGDPGQARHHWQQALNLYAELGAPEADHVRAQLSTAHDDGDSES